MILSFGEVLMDCLPSGNIIGGAPMNVITHLKRLGLNADIITKIGKDEYGKEIKSFLESEGLGLYLQEDKNYATGSVEVTLNNGQPSYKIVRDTAWEHIDFYQLPLELDYVIFGSLAMFSEDNQTVFEKYLSLNPGVKTICDINLRDPLYSFETINYCLQKTDILKINDDELDYLAEQSNVSDAEQWLSSVYGIDKIILTKGSKGAELLWGGDVHKSGASKVSKIEDTVGAGDAFTAMFIYGLINGLSPKEKLKKASDFAAKICEQKGAIPNNMKIYEEFKI